MELRVEHLTKYYKEHRALHDLSFSLKEGIYGLLGPNGSGKTTLIKSLMNLLTYSEGRVLLDGEDICNMSEDYYKVVGYLPQSAKLYPDYTVISFLKYMCLLKGIPKHMQSARIYDVLKSVNLLEESDRKISQLSGGMQQRLGIAQAILSDPKFIVLDEPTAGLDPVERIRFKELILKLSKDKIILIATHIVSDIENITDEILLLKKGVLVAQGHIDVITNRFQADQLSVSPLESAFLKIFSD
jgi:ABC-2 type transport system ATP-binding protein